MGLKESWKFFFIISMPILLLWIPFLWYDSKAGMTRKEGNLLYIIALIVSAWTTNAISSVAAGLMSVCMLPLLGIQKSKPVAENCMTEQGVLLIGQTMIGCAFIICDLHKKLAFRILAWSGHCSFRLLTCVYWNTLGWSTIMSSPAATMIMCATATLCVQECEESMVKEKISLRELRKRSNASQKTTAGPGILKAPLVQIASTDETKTSDDQTAKKKPGGKNNAPANPGNPGTTATSGEGSEPAEAQNPSDSPRGSHDSAQPDTGLEDDLEYKAAMSGMEAVPEPEYEEVVEVVPDLQEQELYSKRLRKRYFIAIYMAANIGGLFLPSSSSVVNIFYEYADPLKEILRPASAVTLKELPLYFPPNKAHVHFSMLHHMAYVSPIVIVLGLFGWLYLVFLFLKRSPALPSGGVGVGGKGGSGDSPKFKLFGKRSGAEEQILKEQKKYYREKYEELGKGNAHQNLVVIIVCLLITLWLTRDPRLTSFKLGWSQHISPDAKGESVRIGDSAVTMMLVVFMFAVPRFTCKKSETKLLTLLSWKFLEANVPWNVPLTMGFQYILSSGAHLTEIANTVLQGFYRSIFPTAAEPVLCILGSILVSELWGGFATANFITPIFSLMSIMDGKYGVLALSTSVASSLCFMFPVATPTNLLVFWNAAGDLSILDMIKHGALMDLVSFIVVLASHYVMGAVLF